MRLRPLLKLATALFAVPALAGVVLAGEAGKPLGVLELFTSQGCNSCPPADALFAELATRDDLIALAYHVDYWDYLGWRDTLAQPESTERQNEYGRALGMRSVYTPQAVINGRSHVNGAKREKVIGTLDRLKGTPEGLTVDVTVTRTGDSVVINTSDGGPGSKEAHLVLVYFNPPQAVDIERGENEGQKFTYWNAVTDIETAGMWHGKAARYELPMSTIKKKGKKGGCAVLLQAAGEDGLPGPILGAAMIRNPAAQR